MIFCYKYHIRYSDLSTAVSALPANIRIARALAAEYKKEGGMKKVVDYVGTRLVPLVQSIGH